MDSPPTAEETGANGRHTMSDYDFDSAYSAITGERVDVLYIPSVSNDPDGDVLIDGLTPGRFPDHYRAWNVLTGHTGQYSYNGAVMHPSEIVDDDTIREWVREVGGDVFAIVEVRDNDGQYPDGDPIGWAVIYRSIGA